MTEADPWQSLGTRGGHVEIAEYSPDWPLVFEREAAAILEACRPYVTEVHHVGSTSVPGLAAKPILDMMPIAAGPAEGLQSVPRMTALGYLYDGESGIPGRFYFDRVRRWPHGRARTHAAGGPPRRPEAPGLPRPPQSSSRRRTRIRAAETRARVEVQRRPPYLHRLKSRLHQRNHRRLDARPRQRLCSNWSSC